MLLHTYQSPDFDISTDIVDYSKSPHYKEDFLKKEYDWLFSVLGTNKVIWCYPQGLDNGNVHGVETKEWFLDIPDNKIIRQINRRVWDLILLDAQIIPDDVYEAWTTEWETLNKNKEPTADEEEAFFAKRELQWQTFVGPKEKQWRDNIFTKGSPGYQEFLIPSPIEKEWIVDIRHYSEYDLELYENCNGCSFNSKDEADRYMNIIYNFMKFRNKPYLLEYKIEAREDYNHRIDFTRG
jgi:hypothetical protein